MTHDLAINVQGSEQPVAEDELRLEATGMEEKDGDTHGICAMRRKGRKRQLLL